MSSQSSSTLVVVVRTVVDITIQYSKKLALYLHLVVG